MEWHAGVRVVAVGAFAASLVAGSVTAAPAATTRSSLTIVAHRGDAAKAPENTNPAFRKAVTKGARAVEMDVRFTRTKRPVILHDLTLDRTTNCSGRVSSVTLTRLRKCDAGRWFHASYRGTRVPTLDSALKTVAGSSGSVKVLLHVKQLPDATMIGRVKAAVARHGMTKRTIIISSAGSILTRMRSQGFTQLGLVFGTDRGWAYPARYYLPYKATVNASRVRAAHRDGAKVWPVENHHKPLAWLLSLSYIDGALVNQLDRTFNILNPPAKPAPTAAPSPKPTTRPTTPPTTTPTPAPTTAPTTTPTTAPTTSPTPAPTAAP